ncbi:hypothetical protein D3C76_1702210 [compost metagenome]
MRMGTQYGQIGAERQAGDVRVGHDSAYRLITRRDGHDRPIEAAGQQVAHHQVAGAARLL